MNRFTVSEVNRLIKQVLTFEDIFYNIHVEGEISNFKHDSSGIMYFTLKDNRSSISCVIFKEYVDMIDFLPKDGMHIVVVGNIGVYEAYGKYQIYCNSLEKFCDEGKLKKNLDDIKNRLSVEGLFSEEHKKPIPKFPKVVGVIAAKGGAAVFDIVSIVSRRFPLVKLKIYFALVQGKKSKESVLKAVKIASKDLLDVLILARGGGSKEDLQTFDDEDLARSVFNLKVPTVAAIGHETDWSIVDLVCDLRVSTPSAAAEVICPNIEDIKLKLLQYKIILKSRIKNIIENLFFSISILKKDINFYSPISYIEYKKKMVFDFKKSLYFMVLKLYEKYYRLFEKNYFLIKLLDPEKILKRGYLIAIDESKRIIKSCYKGKVGKTFNIILKDGEFRVKILEKRLKTDKREFL